MEVRMPRFAVRRLAVRRLAVLGLAATAIAAFWWQGGVSVMAQQGPKVFLSVVDRTGAPITNLQPAEIKLVLDGMPCASTKVEPINWPMKLEVLIDNGDAMANSISSLRDGLRSFFNEIPEDVETSLLTYSPQPRFIVKPTTDRQQLLKGIDLVSPNSGSGAKFLDAVSEAIGRTDKAKGDFFSTIMLITTNGPEGSNGNLDAVVDKMQELIVKRPITVHVMMVAISSTQSVGKVSGAIQTQVGTNLTKNTGGRYENVALASKLPTMLSDFAHQIAHSDLLQSHQYRISCDKSPSKAPKMSVSTSNPNVADVMLSRDGAIP
jgi:hypothetical protein